MKLITTILLLFFFNYALATDYFVKNGGNDANTGLSDAQAWATITKVNSFPFLTTDDVFFKCGSTWTGVRLTVNRSGTAPNIFNFKSYGTGAKPIISGLSTITGWVNLGGNIWEAPTTGVKVTNNLVLRDGVIQQLGRYPNANAANGGFLTNTATTATTLTGPALSSVTNWTGAQVAIRPRRWVVEPTLVTNHVSGTITFDPIPSGTPLVNFGYFFQRDSRTLDIDGEWFQNGSTNKLRMYFANNNPSAYTIQAATVDTLVYGTSKNYITFDDIDFEGAGMNAIRTDNGTGWTVTNCKVNNIGGQALLFWNTNSVTIDNSTVSNTLADGIYLFNSTTAPAVNALCYNDTVTNCGLLAGMNTGAAIGLFVRGGSYANFHNNYIKNIGGNGIRWSGSYIDIRNNYVDSSCLVVDDGGAIYTYSGTTVPPAPKVSRYIVGNILTNIIGNTNGTNVPGTVSKVATGLYQDENAWTINNIGNTVANANGHGIYGNNNDTITVTDNTFFNCYITSFAFTRFATGYPMRGFRVTRNIEYPYKFRYTNSGINSPATTKEADILAMGVIDSNYYSLRPGVDSSLQAITSWADGSHSITTNNNFAYITGTIGQETHSTNVATGGRLYINPTDTVRQVLFIDSIFQEPDGTLDTNAVNIPRWSSKVLIFVGLTTRPVVTIGGPYTITQPVNGTPVSGTATDDGGSVTVVWSQLFGPSTITFTNPNILNPVANGLNNTGSYGIKMTATGTGGVLDVSSASTTIDVNPAIPPPNTPPVFSPAPIASQVKTLPTSTTTATAAATDDVSVTGYRWYYLTGPSGLTISNPAIATPTFGWTLPGIYTLRVVAYDATDSTSTTWQLTVNAAITTPPIPNAGIDRNIVLPQTAVTLTGSGTDGAGCVINSNTWALVSSPVGAFPVITDPADYNSTFTNMLVAGQYRLRLTVTGACGSSASDDIIINVAPVYVPPTGCNCFPTFTKFEN